MHENTASPDWEAQYPFVNPRVMPGCTSALIEACQSGGDAVLNAMLCPTLNQIVSDLGWSQAEDFQYNQLIECVPRSPALRPFRLPHKHSRQKHTP